MPGGKFGILQLRATYALANKLQVFQGFADHLSGLSSRAGHRLALRGLLERAGDARARGMTIALGVSLCGANHLRASRVR